MAPGRMAPGRPEGFSRTQIVLHWTVVALIAFQYLFSDGIEDLWRAAQRGDSVDADEAVLGYLHMAAGITVLVLVAWRLALRFTRGVPAADPSEPAILRLLAALAHFALYALIIILPVSGFVGWVFGVNGAIGAHLVAKKVLLPLIGLHVVGALVHHFVWKTDVLKRMLVPAGR